MARETEGAVAYESSAMSPEKEANRDLFRKSVQLSQDFYHGPKDRRTKHTLRELTESDNPWQALQEMTPELFMERLSSNGFYISIPELHTAYVEYIKESDTWFNKTEQFTHEEKRYLVDHPVASFSLEIAIDKMPQIYSGGLGMLNGDVSREESDKGLPVDNISLLYRQGYFMQGINAEGCQVETYCDQEGNQFPLKDVVGKDGQKIGLLEIPFGDHIVYAKAWEASIGRNKLYLLDTNIPENERWEDTWITGHLYGEASKDTRIRQEFLLGVGGVKLLRALGKEPGIYHLQEGHAAFAILEAIAGLVEEGKSFDEAKQLIEEKTVFTNHTVVVNDFFSEDQVDYYLAPISARMGVSVDQLYALGSDSCGRFSMTELAIRLANKRNGVSSIHTEVLNQTYPEYGFESITNGVHVETWLGEPMEALFDEFLGEKWREHETTEIFNEINNIPDKELWAAKQEQKTRLIAYLNQKYGADLSPDYLTACIARRFAVYKRNTLLLSNMDRLVDIVGDDERPVQIIIGGKAHPHDLQSKGFIQEVNQKIKDPRLEGKKGKIVFVSEYDMELAQRLVSGVDLWINTPRRPLEASGTSGMKAGINGVLQLTSLDGWANEVDWNDKGWTIGDKMDDVRTMNGDETRAMDEKDADELYRHLKEEIVPTFYLKRDEWIWRMKNSAAEVLTRFSTRRMVEEQCQKLYKPIINQQLVMAA